MSKLTELCDEILKEAQYYVSPESIEVKAGKLARAAKLMHKELVSLSDPMENNPYRDSNIRVLAEVERILSE